MAGSYEERNRTSGGDLYFTSGVTFCFTVACLW
jgi:hypothetical protein